MKKKTIYTLRREFVNSPALRSYEKTGCYYCDSIRFNNMWVLTSNEGSEEEFSTYYCSLSCIDKMGDHA